MAGMGGMSDAQHQMFQQRLKRINRGGPNTSGHIIVGPADVRQKAQRPRRMRRPGDFVSRLGGAFGHLVAAPFAFALGGLAMMAGIVGAFQVERIGLPEVAQAGLFGQAALYKEFLIAGLVVLLFGWMFRLLRGPRKLAVVAGVASAFVLQDAIVATYPDAFARLMPDTPLVIPEIAALPAP